MPVTILLLIANFIFSYQGFAKPSLFSRYMLHVGNVKGQRQYERLITSGFLHGSWNHLLVNMMSLYFMGEALERIFFMAYGTGGYFLYLGLYLASMVGGGLLCLLMHRKNPNYSAIGASGAIAGVTFALVAVMPNATILMFFVIPMPFWLFAIVYLAYTLFGIRGDLGNISHEGHMGGALVGLVLGALLMPQLAVKHWIFIVLLAVPTIAVLVLLYVNPTFGQNPLEWVKRKFGGRTGGGPQQRSNPYANPFDGPVKQDGMEVNKRAVLQKELDALLDKVSRKGYHNLTEAEKQRLDELSQYLNRNRDFGGGRAPQH